jgi:hypothetical protein
VEPVEQVKQLLEQTVKSAADLAGIPSSIAGTGDYILVDGLLVEAFATSANWLMFEVQDEALNKQTIGKTGFSRLYGSIIFTSYSPDGQGSSGNANIAGFIHKNFHATEVGNIKLRNARKIGSFDVEGWRAQIVQVAFETNVYFTP